MADRTDYVGTPVDGLVYVLVGERTKFDQILPERVGDNGCHSKAVGDMSSGTVTVIFQWWPDTADAPAPAVAEAA